MVFAISGAVPRNFKLPIINVRFWDAFSTWATVPMPEATINKYSGLKRGNGDVGLTRKVAAVEAVPPTHAGDDLPNGLLRSGITALYRAHDA